jgi:Cupin
MRPITKLFNTLINYNKHISQWVFNWIIIKIYVCLGTGVCGLTVPEAEKEKIIPIKEGDALAIPFGHVTWWFNPNESDLTVLFLGDTSKGHRPGQFTDFHLTGPTGIFTGFTPEFVSRAWDLSENDVAKLVYNQSSAGIVKLKDNQKMPEPSENDRDGLVVNCHEAPLDVDIKGGGCVVVLNSKNLPTVELVGLGADLVRLHGGAMCSPGFSCDSAYQARILSALNSTFI